MSVALSLVALKLLPAPFVSIWVLWGALGLAVTVTSRSTPFRLCGLAAATTLMTFGSIEAWLQLRTAPTRPVIEYLPSNPREPDSILGWHLAPARATRARSRLGGSTIYDVIYTVDSSGRRIAPPDSGSPSQGCILFFADSFVFGEGLPDADALPYRVGILTAGRYRVANFAGPGYGAEHMLAAIEHGMVQSRTPCRPTHVVYEALPHHVLRAAGRTSYSRRGPRYRIGPDGGAVYVGTPRPIAPGQPSLLQRARQLVDGQLRKSLLLQGLEDREPRPTEADVTLYLAVVARARDRFAAAYPGVEFHVLAWSIDGYYARGFDRFRNGLAAITPNLHIVDDILTGYAAAPQRYQIDAADRHPNALANRLLAEFVSRNIVHVPAEARRR